MPKAVSVAAKLTDNITNMAAPGGFVGALLFVAGRFRPTGWIAKRALPALRSRGLISRFVMSRLNGRRIALDLDEDVDAKVFLYGAYDERGLKLMKRIMRAVDCRTAI